MAHQNPQALLAAVSQDTERPNRVFEKQEGWERLLLLGDIVKAAKKEIVVEQGAEPTHCYVVLVGTLLAKERRDNGECIIHSIYREGSLVLEPYVLTGQTALRAYFEAAEDSVLKKISKEEFEGALEKDPELMRFVLRSLSTKLISKHQQINDIYSHNASTRLYSLLFTLSELDEDDPDAEWADVPAALSQQDISDLLGVNRTTTVRALGELKDLGILKMKGRRYSVKTASTPAQGTQAQPSD